MSYPLRMIVTAFTLLLAIGSGTLQAQSADLLRWKLKAGDKYEIEMTQSATQELDLGGPQTIQSDFTMRMSMTVDAAREHEFDVTQRIESIKFKMDSPFLQMEYDSASEEEPDAQTAMIADGFKPLIGLNVKQTINDRGESLKVDIDADKLAAVEQNQMAGQFVTKDSFRQLLSANGLVFPENALTPGDTWDGTFEQSSGGVKMSTKSAFTLAGTEKSAAGNECQKISSKHEITMVPDENAPVTIELKSQDSTGEFLFDNTAGRLDSATINQDLVMSIDQGGMQMDVKTKSKSKFTLTPLDK